MKMKVNVLITFLHNAFYTNNYLQAGFHFINFYSPFCPPCQNLVDHWKNLAEIYKGIVKVGAVNCKYYNSFCYNSMRIGSYPSLLFYPNGKNGNFIYYRGDRTFEALDSFVMNYLRNHVHVPIVTQIHSTDTPMAYVLGTNRIERDTLTRMGYRLKGLVTLVIVEDDGLRGKLTKNEYITVVFKYKGTTKEIESTDEKEVMKEIVEALPKIELIDPDKLKKIRNQLRNGHKYPWVLYFSSKGHDRLTLHQMRIAYSDMHFGEIDCDKYVELCGSLQVEQPPAWAVLKPGGAYQLAGGSADVRAFIQTAAVATNLHSLSASDLLRIIDDDMGSWILLVVPYQLSWDHMIDPFTRASLHFGNSHDISFGIMVCTINNDKYCRQLASEQPVVVVQHEGRSHHYNGRLEEKQLAEFIELIVDSGDLELTENEILEIMSSSREHSWLVAFFPAPCDRSCEQLLHEWRIVAKKLGALPFVRVGALRCGRGAAGICGNVRAPTARLYPYPEHSGHRHHYAISLQHLSQAPYILEWALDYLDDSVQKLNWHTFSKSVAAEELRPTRGRRPWLVYFHSPRCYRCYEMYADFVIAGIHLNNAVNVGKVNCLNERNLCTQEQITSYPSLKLYLNRNQQQSFSSVISIPIKDHSGLLSEIKPHLIRYDDSLLSDINIGVKSQGFHIKHDEF